MRSSTGVPRRHLPFRLVIAVLLSAGLTAIDGQAVAQTCTSFVNATDGDDSNPGSQILPWRSVEYAFESADAGETVCIAAGEYFYGEDADGIEFAVDGKSLDFVIRAFAGETEVRLSERFVRIDTGSGVVRFLAGTADELTLGAGLVNSDDPSEPDLLNFMHSLELVSGTLDVSDVSLTLGASVGNPDFVNPDNPDKTAPGNAAIRIDDGRLIGNPTWAPGSRTYIYTSTGSIGDASIALPAALAGSTLSFEHAGTIAFPNALDARGVRLQFGHSGAVVFESEVRLNAATTTLEWTNGATGSVSFDGDVRVTSTQPTGGELVFSGPGDVYIARLLAEPALNGSHTARLVHDSGGLFRLARMETGPGTESGPFELAFTQLSGTAELGDPATTLNPPGPIENSGILILKGDLSMGPAASSLSNSGLLEIDVFDLILQESGTVVLNSGVITNGASGDGTVRVSEDASVSGGGTLPSLRVEGGVLALDTQNIQGDIAVNSGGQLDLVTDAVLSVAGDVFLHTDPSFTSANGSILMTGQNQSLSILSGGTFPEFRLPDGDVTVTPGSSSLPAFMVDAGSLTANVDGDLNVTGALRMTGGSAIISAAGTVMFRDGASVQNGMLRIQSAEPIGWDGLLDSGNGTLDIDAPGLAPLIGSTIRFVGETPIVLPGLFPGASGATIRVATRVEVASDLVLSSGVILFEQEGSMAVSGNLRRTSGRFEPDGDSFLELYGSATQIVSGFSGSVLPSLHLNGSDVSISEPLTILGDVSVLGGSTTIENDSPISLSGAFSQTGGVFRLVSEASLFAAGGMSVTEGDFEAGSGDVRSSGPVSLMSPWISTGAAELILDGPGERSVSIGADVAFRSVVVRSGAAALVSGPGSMTLSGGLGVRADARLDLLGGFEILMTGASAPPVITNAGRIRGSGFIRLAGPSGPDPFALSGRGEFGAVSIELADDESTVRLSDMDTLRVSGAFRFVSGGVGAAGRRVELVTENGTPGIILNLEDSIGGAGSPDGRGFLDLTGPLDLDTDGGRYDLAYTGPLTAPYTAGDEYIQGRIRNLTVGSPDAVNTPPVFGVSLGGFVRVPGTLTVEPASLLRLNDGSIVLDGQSVVHRMDGRILGNFDVVIEGAGSTLVSSNPAAHIRSLVLESPAESDEVLISGLPSTDRLRMNSGVAAIRGEALLRLGTSMILAGGRLTLGAGVAIGSENTAGILDVAGAQIHLDTASFIGFPHGAAIEIDPGASVELTQAARATQDRQTGFIILEDESSISAPGGIPRLSLNPIPGTAGSDDFFLSGDVHISDALLHRNGDLFLGSNVLRLSGGFVDYDADSAAFDGPSDEIVGDVAGGGGVIEVTGGVDFRLATDLLVQGATVIVDAPGELVRLVSTTSTPRQFHVAALPLELRAGTIDLGTNDLRVTGSSTNLLFLGDVDVIASSAPQAPAGMHQLVRRDDASFPLRDQDFGEIVIDGSGNASVVATHPVTIPSLRIDGTIRLPVSNEPMTVSRRLVFGRTGATILAESATDLRLSGGAALVRRGEGTLARLPVLDGPIDVFYDLDDGDLTGTDTGYEGTLSTGLELPATVRRLGVFAGGASGAPANRVLLASDVTVSSLMAVYSGTFDRSNRTVALLDDALLAVDQVDANAPAVFTGNVDWTGSGEVDVLLGASVVRIDPDTSILPPGVAIDSLILSLGRTGAPAMTVRQRIPIVVNDLVVQSPGPRGTYRFDGMDVTATRGIRIENSSMQTSGLAGIQSGSMLSIGQGSDLSGSVDVRVGGSLLLAGHFGGLSLDVAGDIEHTGTLATAARIRFSGTDQTWTIPASVQTGVLELQMASPATGPPVLRLASESGAVGRTLTVNGTLHFDSGLLDTGDQRVLLKAPDGGFTRAPGAGTDGAPPSHILGTVIRRAEAESTGPIVFPVGDASVFRPLTLEFPSPLLSDTDLGVRFESLPFAGRNGLPVQSPDGVTLRDASDYAWRVTSSVNFAQSQPVTVTAMTDQAVAGDPELHRLLQRVGGDLSAPWFAVGGSPVVSLVENGILVRSVGAAGLLRPEGVSIGIGVPETVYAAEGQLQVVNMAPGAARDVLLSDERIVRSMTPGSAGGTITLGLGGSGPEPISLAIRDTDNSTIETSVETTIEQNQLTIVALTAGPDGGVDAYVIRSDATVEPADGLSRLGFLHLDPSAGGLEIALDRPSATPVFSADVVGFFDGPVELPAEPLLMIPVPVVDGAFPIEEFRVDLTPLSGANALLVAADASLFGAATDSPFLAVVARDGTVRASTIVTGTETGLRDVPDSFRLGGNYPNPFTGRTTLTFDLPETAHVRLIVADMLGRVVRQIDAGHVEAGAGKRLQFDAHGLAAGVYVYRLEADSGSEQRVNSGTMVIAR